MMLRRGLCLASGALTATGRGILAVMIKDLKWFEAPCLFGFVPLFAIALIESNYQLGMHIFFNIIFLLICMAKERLSELILGDLNKATKRITAQKSIIEQQTRTIQQLTNAKGTISHAAPPTSAK